MSRASVNGHGDFSVVRGGPLYRLLARSGHPGDQRQLAVRSALFAVTVAWLPLLALSSMQGQAHGHGLVIPFFRDFGANVRFLIALPILVLAEPPFHRRWQLVADQFLRSKLVPDADVPIFEALLAKTRRLRDHVLPEILLLVLAFSLLFLVTKTEMLTTGVSNWHTAGTGSDHRGMAGWWFTFVSAPLFRFLLLRWVWRLFLVTLWLWRVSRMNLYLVATHADLAGGLGFLSQGQRAFGPIVFAGGAVIAAQVANAIAYQGATLSSMKSPMVAYGVFALVFFVAPLLVVTPVLVALKRRALFEYGALVTIHNQQFHQAWIRKHHPPDVAILGDPGPSSLIDLGDSFAVISRMRIVPLDKQTVIALALAAMAPMLAVVLFATPANELLGLVLKMLR